MEYIPPEDSDVNHNVSSQHPLSEVSWLLGGLVVLLLASYLILGLLVDLIVPYVPPSTEATIGKAFQAVYSDELTGPQKQRLEALFAGLSQHVDPAPEQPYRVHIVEADQVNALAIPGGDIVLFSQLLEEAESENEVAMVLGHEIGHLTHRHSLRSLGRTLVLMAVSDIVLGHGNAVSRVMMPGLNSLQLNFSRSQETDADEVGLQLLNAYYGHAAGATDFFERLSQNSQLSKLESYLSTHPDPAARVQHLKDLIQERDLPLQEKTPWRWPQEKS